MSFLLQVLSGLVAGIVCGFALGTEHLDFINAWIAPFGIIFLRLLRMMIIPLVMSSLVVGVTGVGDVSKFGRIGGKTFGLYMFTTIFAASLGIAMGIIFEPGAGVALKGTAATVMKDIPSFSQMIIDFFPFNPVRSMLEDNMLQLIVFSIAMGMGILLCKGKAQLLVDFASQVAKVCYKIIGGVMKAAPLGIFAMVTPIVAANGPDVLMPLIKFLVYLYVALFLHCIFVYGSLLKFVARVNPINYLKKVFPAVAFAFSSSSSSATLPVTMTYCRWMNISKEVASFVLPLGATVNMDGVAIQQGMAAVFAAQVCGLELTALHYMYIAVFGTLFSIGCAGVPGASAVSLSILFSATGLPLEALALLLGIDRIAEMGVTAMNVAGDTVVCGVVAKTEGETLDV